MMMKNAILIIISVFLICTACSTQNTALELGDTKAVMFRKMKELGAKDVTWETDYTFYHTIFAEQEYYWWKLEDKTIIAVLLTGTDNESLDVAVIEIGEPGKGVEGIANWRSQKLKCKTFFPYKRQRNLEALN